jgi:Domain of Unknown Function with PDB structure (DUF3862)
MKRLLVAAVLAACVTGPAVAGQYNTACGVSFEKFNAIKMGIKYQEAVDLLGCAGSLSSSSQSGKSSHEIRGWDGDQGGSMFLSFQNGRLTTKSQNGLQ